jgi:hypothetical protein
MNCENCPYRQKMIIEVKAMLEICRGREPTVPKDATEPTISFHETEAPANE